MTNYIFKYRDFHRAFDAEHVYIENDIEVNYCLYKTWRNCKVYLLRERPTFFGLFKTTERVEIASSYQIGAEICLLINPGFEDMKEYINSIVARSLENIQKSARELQLEKQKEENRKIAQDWIEWYKEC